MQKQLHTVDTILYTKKQIEARVAELAAEISGDYKRKDLILVSVLKGSVIFLSDLSRRLAIPHAMDMMGAASYGSETSSTGHVMITKDVDLDIRNKHVLLVEDIFDTGRTLKVLIDMLRARKPASVEVCCFLKKRKRRRFRVPVKYVGFTVPDTFLVGYGLDLNEHYRNLEYIASIKPRK